MNKSIRVSILFLLVFFTAFSTVAQEKRYKTVYKSEKTGDSWGGTKKTTFSASIERNEKGEGPVSISILSGNSTTVKYNLTCDFEAMTGEGKAFHRVIDGPVYGAPNWTSHTGSTDVNWVYLNKSIREILAEPEYLPFDVEVQFGDGSAVKYLISK